MDLNYWLQIDHRLLNYLVFGSKKQELFCLDWNSDVCYQDIELIFNRKEEQDGKENN